MSRTSEKRRQLTRDEIEARAADFLERRRFWDWTAQDDASLQAWLDDSITHRVAYLRLAAGAARLERLAALRPQRQAKLAADTQLGILRRLMFPVLAGASALGLVTLLGIVALAYFLHPSDHAFATEIGGRALLKFADGTQIEVNTDTALHYRMTTDERVVWLDRGEAYFRVAHDPAHPFVVFAGSHRVTDLGTEFLVRRAANELEVSLVTGRAELSSDDPRAAKALLTPGDDAIATPQSFAIVKKSQQQMADELSWQRGVVVFRHAPLADAVEQFNRYNLTKLVIADSRAGRLRVGGEFKTNNLADFLQLAQLVLKLHVEKKGADIWLSSDAAQRGGTARDVRSP